jgi:hypothetical protein
MTSAVITLFKRCTCGEPLSLWQYDMETSGRSDTDMLNEFGFKKMCCLMRARSRPMLYVTDYMADARVIENNNGNIVRERGYVVEVTKPLP